MIADPKLFDEIERIRDELDALIPDDAVPTYFVESEGLFRETPAGLTKEIVIQDLAAGRYDSDRVFRQCGGRFEDVTEAIADFVSLATAGRAVA